MVTPKKPKRTAATRGMLLKSYAATLLAGTCALAAFIAAGVSLLHTNSAMPHVGGAALFWRIPCCMLWVALSCYVSRLISSYWDDDPEQTMRSKLKQDALSIAALFGVGE